MSLPDKKNIVLITGLSGAGRSSALKIMEDMGYDAIDNLPLLLLPALLKQTHEYPHIAIGVDVRSQHFGPQRLRATLDALKALPGYNLRLLYLDCDDEILQKRFAETRRRHPISGDLLEAIQKERERISSLKDHANEVIDTSVLSQMDFRKLLNAAFSLENEAGKLRFQVVSFAYRRGLPRHADLVIDARCLSNPFYEPSLSALDGRDQAVQDFLRDDPLWDNFTASIKSMVELSVKGFLDSSRSYVTIACGCTGGQHRSVFLAESLSDWLKSQRHGVSLEHRELNGDR